MANPEDCLRLWTQALQAEATGERATQEKRYLKSSLRFLGATVPQIRAQVRSGMRAVTLADPEWRWDREQVHDIVELCWKGDLHEHRAIGCQIVQFRAKALQLPDLSWLESILRNCGTWAYVDTLAVHGVGSIVARYPDESKAVLARWATDADVWIARSALLALLGAWRLDTPFDKAHFVAWSQPLLPRREFWLRKAVGWVLREVAKQDPLWVQGFVQDHAATISGLTRREAERGVVMGLARPSKGGARAAKKTKDQ